MSKQIIFHIDVNSAYLSWTALSLLANKENADIRLIPAIIGGDQSKRHGVVLAKSIPAKSYGIVTGEPVVNAFRKCPNLEMFPPNHRLYEDQSRNLMRFLKNICPDLEQVSVDECFMHYTPISNKYPSPEIAANQIREEIYQTFGFTVNIGISDKRVLAKMASDFKKPNLVHTLYSDEIESKIWHLPVSSLFMCGRSSVNTLRNLGITTIGELALSDPSIIEGHLKSHGLTLWNYANGIDDSPVISKPAKSKGVGNSTTLQEDVITKESAYQTLLYLAESVGGRLRSSGEAASVVCTEIKYATFQSVSHQITLESPTDSTNMIYQVACDLFDELWDESPIRLLGIRTTKLSSNTVPVQMNLFDMSNEITVSEKQKKLDSALDSIKERFGEDAIQRGSFMKQK